MLMAVFFLVGAAVFLASADPSQLLQKQAAAAQAQTLQVRALGAQEADAQPYGKPSYGIQRQGNVLVISNKAPLFHFGSLDSFDRTEGGTQAAKLVIEAINEQTANPKRSAAAASEAIDIYKRIIPDENFGGEYTALQWICEYLIASEADRKNMLTDRLTVRFHRYWSEDDWVNLIDYLEVKYKLPRTVNIQPKVVPDSNPNPKAQDKTQPKAKDNTGEKGKENPKAADKPDDPSRSAAAFIQRFHEDMILFSNPRRERWEQTSKYLEALKLKQGDTVADIGCGPGYYTLKFSNIVGPKGKVYASDINEDHLGFLDELIKEKPAVKNIEIVRGTWEDPGIPAGEKVDCVFLCSLYHVIYATYFDKELPKFLKSIRASLKDNGKLVIVDNALIGPGADGKKLPYHGPYIAKELIVAQLEHSGFVLKETHQFIPQRYMLIFEKGSKPDTPVQGNGLAIDSANSLILYKKTVPPYPFTKGGQDAAKLFYTALQSKNKSDALLAKEEFVELIPTEKFGSEYSAFIWICDYIAAAPDEKQAMLADKHVKDYFDRLGGDDFPIVKKYVHTFYDLNNQQGGGPGGAKSKPNEDSGAKDMPETKENPRSKGSKGDQGSKGTKGGNEAPTNKSSKVAKTEPEFLPDTVNEWHEMIQFNNPRRESWEKTSEVLKFLKLKKTDVVADVGCGHGYFTFKFAPLVKKVWALETNQDVLDVLKSDVKRHNYTNIEPRKSTYDNCQLDAESVDVMFLCSLYHDIYMLSIDFVIDRFIESMKKALKKGGRLVIIDNEVAPKDADGRLLPPYYGPRIDRRLIIEQLKLYGFKLVEQTNVVPQRYILIFEKE